MYALGHKTKGYYVLLRTRLDYAPRATYYYGGPAATDNNKPGPIPLAGFSGEILHRPPVYAFLSVGCALTGISDKKCTKKPNQYILTKIRI